MAALESEDYNTKRSIATIVKASCASKGLLIPPPYSYSAIKRLIDVDEDESVTASEDTDDPLAEELVEAAEDLRHTERAHGVETSVEPTASLAALFDSTPEARELKPRLWLAWDVQDEPQIVGILTACAWTRDDSLGTTRFTGDLCSQHRIPRFTSTNTLFVDVVSSRRGAPHGVGALCLLSAYGLVSRSRSLEYLCTIAVTDQGRTLCEKLGMRSYAYREGGARFALCWTKGGELKASDINRRLRLKSSVIEQCWRSGLTPRTSEKRYPRC